MQYCYLQKENVEWGQSKTSASAKTADNLSWRIVNEGLWKEIKEVFVNSNKNLYIKNPKTVGSHLGYLLD